jgi:hypothetical protein
MTKIFLNIIIIVTVSVFNFSCRTSQLKEYSVTGIKFVPVSAHNHCWDSSFEEEYEFGGRYFNIEDREFNEKIVEEIAKLKEVKNPKLDYPCLLIAIDFELKKNVKSVFMDYNYKVINVDGKWKESSPELLYLVVEKIEAYYSKGNYRCYGSNCSLNPSQEIIDLYNMRLQDYINYMNK